MSCQYCGEKLKLTREHIIPAFIYKKQKELGESFTGWNEYAYKVIGGEAKIADVCADCNNVILSELDDCACRLLEKSGLFVENFKQANLAIEYDYNLLLRWLLKVSFNSARASKAQEKVFHEYLDFILGRSSAPTYSSKIKLFVSLNKPISADSSEEIKKLAKGSKKFNPFRFAVSYNAALSDLDTTHRVVIVGPAIFHLFFHKLGDEREYRKRCRYILKNLMLLRFFQIEVLQSLIILILIFSTYGETN